MPTGSPMQKGIGPILFRLAMLHHIATTNKRDAMSWLNTVQVNGNRGFGSNPNQPLHNTFPYTTT